MSGGSPSPSPADSPSPGHSPADVAPPSVEPTGAPGAAQPDITVTITFGTWNTASAAVEVGAHVEGVVENGGSCALRLSKGGQVVGAKSTGVADASTTACDALAVSGAVLTSGTWAATVAYTSSTSHAISASIDIEVP